MKTYAFRIQPGQDLRNEIDRVVNEKNHQQQVVEMIARPTGLIDPEIVVKPADTQVDDLLGEIKKRVEVGERVLDVYKRQTCIGKRIKCAACHQAA